MTHLDAIRKTLEATESGRRALAVLEAVQDYDAHGDYGDETGACPCEVCRTVRALLAEAADRPPVPARTLGDLCVQAGVVQFEAVDDSEHYDAGATLAAIGRLAALLAEAGEAAANPSPTCQLAARARDYREYHHRLEAGETIDLGLCATTAYVLDVELRNGCPLGKETRIPGDEPVASKTDAREVADTRPEAATRQPATATRNLLAGSEMVVQFRPPPDRPIDVGEGWEPCARAVAEQYRWRCERWTTWSGWMVAPDAEDPAVVYQYRRRARTCATCRYRGHNLDEWPCVDCREHDRWDPPTEGGAI